MPKTHAPRHGSMQFWPRVKAKKPLARIRSWSTNAKEPVLGFIGYKAGMTHIIGVDSRKNAITKGDEISEAVTIVECPPMKIAGIRVYRTVYGKVQPSKDIQENDCS
jgi:large subunit ribosomal protein L3